MKPLNKQNILSYLEKNIFSHLDFITQGQLQEFKKMKGGLVSRVFRLVVDKTPFYLKRVIKSVQYEKFFPDQDNQDDFEKKALNEVRKWIFNNNRQIPESRALKILEKKVNHDITPHIYYHDTSNRVLILSEVCPDGKLLENIIDKKINLEASKNLAKFAAKLVSNTYGKTNPLRSVKEDKKVKFIKLKYQCLEVYKNLDPKIRNRVKILQTKFVQESMKINKVLVHGEYHPRNILVNGAKIGTFDLEEAHLGDPAFDIGILLGSYLLRADYHKNIRPLVIKSVLEMINVYLNKINIPENRKDLENRIKHYIGGLMLGRIDGISSSWTVWFKKENAKRTVRQHATQIILDDKTPLYNLIQKIHR